MKLLMGNISLTYVVTLPRDDAQHGLLEPSSIWYHFSQLLPYASDLLLDPNLVVGIDDERLRHSASESLF